MHKVILTSVEIEVANTCGRRRRTESLARGYASQHGAAEAHDPIDLDLMGARGEMAAAKFLNVYWSGAACAKQDEDLYDIGFKYEIRTVDDNRKRLIVRPGDPDDRIFILVIEGKVGLYTIAGWMLAGAAKQNRDWKANPNNAGEAWFVSRTALKSLHDLPHAPSHLETVSNLVPDLMVDHSI